jgi:hypothetical protein
MTTTKGFRASAWPLSTLRTPLFARHYRHITTLNNVFSDSGDRNRWRRARIKTVISVLEFGRFSTSHLAFLFIAVPLLTLGIP